MTHRTVLPLVLVATVALGAAGAALAGGRASPATAQQTETIQLFAVCNNVSLTWPNGTATAMVAAAVMPQTALRSIWRFNNAAQAFEGFSPMFPMQSDLRTVNLLDPVFICMDAPGSLMRPFLPPGGTMATPTATPSPTATPVAGGIQVTIVSPMVMRGGTLQISVQGPAGTSCSATITLPNLMQATAGPVTIGATGQALLTYPVPAMAPTGLGSATVSCAGSPPIVRGFNIT